MIAESGSPAPSDAPAHPGRGGQRLAEAQAPQDRLQVRKPRTRAGIARRRPGGRAKRHLGLGGFLLFAIVALGVLAGGLLAASQTIFAGNAPSGGRAQHGALAPTKTPATSSLVGSPLDGTILAVSLAENTIAIQPVNGAAIQVTVTAGSKLTKDGAAVSLASLIPGEDCVVTLSQGPGGTLVVQQLQDIVSIPTNTPSPTYFPTSTYFPTPTYSPRPTPAVHPSPGPPTPSGPGTPLPGGPSAP